VRGKFGTTKPIRVEEKEKPTGRCPRNARENHHSVRGNSTCRMRGEWECRYRRQLTKTESTNSTTEGRERKAAGTIFNGKGAPKRGTNTKGEDMGGAANVMQRVADEVDRGKKV